MIILSAGEKIDFDYHVRIVIRKELGVNVSKVFLMKLIWKVKEILVDELLWSRVRILEGETYCYVNLHKIVIF